MIELKEIYLKRNKRAIFNGFNLKVQPKERLVIVGESGSGKSTLLRLIAGLERPDSGDIYIRITSNKLVTKDREILIEPYERGVNMVFQDLALWTHLNVEGNIAFGLKVKGFSKEKITKKVDEMLFLVGLEGYKKRAIETLSGGEQQRIALARALATNPKVLLMDEPLSSLDSKRKSVLSQKIVELQELLGFTLLYVTHSQIEAEYIATRVVEL